MLDVHILHSDSTPSAAWERCLASVASERATIKILDGVDGHIGKGRYEGFSRGANPFVTYVDDDDMVSPGLLDYLHDALEEHPDTTLIYVRNRALPKEAPPVEPIGTPQLTVSQFARARHHLHTDHMLVYRRDTIDILRPLYLRYDRGGDIAMLAAYKMCMNDSDKVLVSTEQMYFWCGGV